MNSHTESADLLAIGIDHKIWQRLGNTRILDFADNFSFGSFDDPREYFKKDLRTRTVQAVDFFGIHCLTPLMEGFFIKNDTCIPDSVECTYLTFQLHAYFDEIVRIRVVGIFENEYLADEALSVSVRQSFSPEEFAEIADCAVGLMAGIPRLVLKTYTYLEQDGRAKHAQRWEASALMEALLSGWYKKYAQDFTELRARVMKELMGNPGHNFITEEHLERIGVCSPPKMLQMNIRRILVYLDLLWMAGYKPVTHTGLTSDLRFEKAYCSF